MRAGDIVKGVTNRNSNQNSTGERSSPERALLSNQGTPMHQNQDSGSIYTETIDLSSPGFNMNMTAEPPRNIFDDI